MIKTVNQLNRLKTNVPFSQRLNDWINEWFEQHKQYFVFVDTDDFNGDDIEGTFRSHQKRFHEEGVIHIWTGASDSTIFGSNEMNYKFRAWHDYFHITRGFGYDFAGESIVCQIQKEMIPDDWTYEKELIHCEIIGQAQFFVYNRYFIDNQRLFTIMYLNNGIENALQLTNKN